MTIGTVTSAPESKSLPQKKQQTLDLLNKQLNEYVQAAQAHAAKWIDYYHDGDNYLFNNQLHGKRRKKGWDRIQVNEIFPAVMQELSILTMRTTQIQTLPWENSDEEGANLWNGALQWQYEKNLEVPELLQRAVLDGKRTGHWVVKVWWEDEAEWDAPNLRWKGKVKRKLIRHQDFGVDPAWSTNDIGDAEYVFTLRRVPVEWAVNRWPEYEDNIRKAAREESADATPWGPGETQEPYQSEDVELDGDAIGGEHDTGPAPGGEGRLAALIQGRPRSASLIRKDTSESAMVTLLEIWLNDYTRETVTDEEDIPAEELEADGRIRKDIDGWRDTEGGDLIHADDWPKRDLPSREQPLYPNGRHVIRVGRDTVLVDRAWHLPRWPFAYAVNTRLPHTWHGLNGIEMARGAQDYRNIAAMHMANHTKQFGDPVIAVEQNALQESSDNRGVAGLLRSGAGAIWKLNRGGLSRIKRFDPSSMSAGVLDFFDRMGQAVRDALGMQEIGMGRQAGDGAITATEAIRLESATRLRTALQATIIDSFLTDLMELVCVTCQYHWSVGDMVRVVGERRQEEVEAIAGLTASEPNVMPRQMEVSGALLEARFDLKLEVTTTMPYDKERKKLEADKVLLEVGPAYLRRWLEIYDVQDVDTLVRGHDAWQAVQAVMAAESGVGADAQGTPTTGSEPEPTKVAGGVPAPVSTQ